MDYLKHAIPSQLLAQRGSNLVVINPGSSNIRIGLAHQEPPFCIPHCIARLFNQVPKLNVKDQLLNSSVTIEQHLECEEAYNIIASWLKISPIEEIQISLHREGKHQDESASQYSGKIAPFASTTTKKADNFSEEDRLKQLQLDGVSEKQNEGGLLDTGLGISDCRKFICGEESLTISPTDPYCLHRPIRRGHFNISNYYTLEQVLNDMHTIWEFILVEKLHIPLAERNAYSAVLVLPQTFDAREIKETVSLVLGDLGFSSVVIHQEALAVAFGSGLSTACVVDMGAHTTSVICVEDGVVLPNTEKILPFGGEDISRCLLWTQRQHHTWPLLQTDILSNPIDLLLLNKLKETYCEIRDGEFSNDAMVYSYEDSKSVVSHKTRLVALNVAPMGLFYPSLLLPDVFPPPPRAWFHDYDNMLDDTWHMDFPRKTDISDGIFSGISTGLSQSEAYSVLPSSSKEMETIGLAEAICQSIISSGRSDLKRKLFGSILLAGGVALTAGITAAVEERVFNALRIGEDIDTVEVLPSKTDPTFMAWKGGAILGVLDLARENWVPRDEWMCNGVHVGSSRKYKDSVYVQAQAMGYINS